MILEPMASERKERMMTRTRFDRDMNFENTVLFLEKEQEGFLTCPSSHTVKPEVIVSKMSEISGLPENLHMRPLYSQGVQCRFLLESS